MKILIKILTVSLAALPVLVVLPQAASAQPFIYPGIQSSAEAGLSQTNTRGTAAVLWNPANIVDMPSARKSNSKKKQTSLLGIETYADLSLLSLDYSYTRSGYDPVKISVVAPPITVGVAWRPQPKFAFGVLFVPKPATKPQRVSGLPLRQNKDVILVDADILGSNVMSGFGMSIKPNGRFSLGLSVIEVSEVNTLSATPEGDGSGVPLFQMSFSGSFMQYLLGFKAKMNEQTIIGGGFKTSVVKKYTGDLSIAGGTPEPTTKQGYAPMELAIGAEHRVGKSDYMGEYRRMAWAAGAGEVREGTPGGTNKKAYNDVNIFIIGTRYHLSDERVASVGYGYYPGNSGAGSELDENGKSTGDELIGGVGVGEFEALNRHVFAGGFRFAFKDAYVHTAVSMQNASRNIPADHANEGTHTMTAFTLAVGGGKSF